MNRYCADFGSKWLFGVIFVQWGELEMWCPSFDSNKGKQSILMQIANICHLISDCSSPCERSVVLPSSSSGAEAADGCTALVRAGVRASVNPL